MLLNYCYCPYIRTTLKYIHHFANIAKGYLKKIQASSNLLLTIINQVLEMARIESGTATLNLEPCNLSELFHSVNFVFESDVKKKGLHFQVDSKVQHHYAFCDITKLQQIYLNIVSNAIKYTPADYAITVSVIEVPSHKENYARYIFVCEDTGYGMSEEFLPHILKNLRENIRRQRTKSVVQV